MLHDLEMGGCREPFACVDRSVYPDTFAAGARTRHLHTNHTIDWTSYCVPLDTKHVISETFFPANHSWY